MPERLEAVNWARCIIPDPESSKWDDLKIMMTDLPSSSNFKVFFFRVCFGENIIDWVNYVIYWDSITVKKLIYHTADLQYHEICLEGCHWKICKYLSVEFQDAIV